MGGGGGERVMDMVNHYFALYGAWGLTKKKWAGL